MNVHSVGTKYEKKNFSVYQEKLLKLLWQFFTYHTLTDVNLL